MAERGSGGDGPFKFDDFLRNLLSKSAQLSGMSKEDQTREVGNLLNEHGLGTREKLLSALTSVVNIFRHFKENKDEDNGPIQ